MSKLLLAAGLVLGLITAFSINFYVDSVSEAQFGAPFLKLNPSVSLSSGEVLEESMLEVVQLPESFSSLSVLAIPDDGKSRDWILQRRVFRDVPAGALLQYNFFMDDPQDRFASKIGEGKRAMTIPVNPVSAVAFFVEPGSYVDLVGTFDTEVTESIKKGKKTIKIPTGQIRTETKTILQDIKILAVGQASTRGTYVGAAGEGYGTLTIEVSSEQAEKLVFAMAEIRDGLTVLLRNPVDRGSKELPALEWKNIK